MNNKCMALFVLDKKSLLFLVQVLMHYRAFVILAKYANEKVSYTWRCNMISIIMPTYNRENTIEKSIKSVLNQTYQDWELLIVDDKSTDNSKSLIEKYARKHFRIKYIFNWGEKGVSGARNTGLKEACGCYIAFLDSDDTWVEHHLQTSIDILRQSKCSMSFSLWIGKLLDGVEYKVFSDECGKKLLEDAISATAVHRAETYIVFDNKAFMEYILLNDFYCVSINTVVFDKDLLNLVEPFSTNLRASEDIDFLIRLIEVARPCLIQDYHYVYHQGEDNLYYFTNRYEQTLTDILGNEELIKKLTICDMNKVEMYKQRKAFIKKSGNILNKKDCKRKCNEQIFSKLITMSLINQKRDRKYALLCCLKSFRFQIRQANVMIFMLLLRSNDRLLVVPKKMALFLN